MADNTKNWDGVVRWIKISTNIFDDEKIKLIETMPEGDTILIIWFKLLVQAGLINNNGFIYLRENIPYTDEMLAVIFNRPINTIRLALQTFKNFGMIDIADTNEIVLLNWEKYQNLDRLEQIREQGRKRVQKYRDKQQKLLQNSCNVTCNANVTQSNALEKEKEKEKENIYIQKNDLKIFLQEYEKVFLRVPFLSEEMKDKILQIMGNNPLIKDKLPEIFKTLKNTEFNFKNGKSKPDIVWLLKDNNFYKIANGEINGKQGQTSISKEQRIADMQRMHEEEKRNNK